jgi:hypothetical protein
MVTSGLASGRVSIQVAAIETRSLPSSLAAARRGFTFYLADPSARLTSIAKAVRVNLPYQKGADLDIIPQWRAYCVNDSITRLISPGDSAPFISLRFAVNSAE